MNFWTDAYFATRLVTALIILLGCSAAGVTLYALLSLMDSYLHRLIRAHRLRAASQRVKHIPARAVAFAAPKNGAPHVRRSTPPASRRV